MTEVRSAFQIDRSHEDYFAAISGKTAALTATSCRIGALTGGLPTAEVEACTEFGRCFGMVFQIRDDILDITATDGQLQKPAGQDLAEGIYTLPGTGGAGRSRRRAGPARAARAAPGPARARQGPGHRDGVARDRRRGRRGPAPTSTTRRAATAGISQPDLRAGLSRLVAELLSDLPG